MFGHFWYATYSSTFLFLSKCLFKIWVFIICVKGDAMYPAKGLIKEFGVLWNPLEQSLEMLFIIFSISSLFFCSSKNCSSGKLSGSDSMKVLISENLASDFPVTCLQVLLKILLASLTFSLMVIVP